MSAKVAEWCAHWRKIFHNLFHTLGSPLPDRIDDVRPRLKMIQIPMSVVLLNCFVHPAQNGSNLGRIVTRVPYNRIDRMPEGVSRQASSLPVNSGPIQRLAEPFSPPGLTNPRTIIIGEYEVLRSKADGFHLKLIEFVNRS